MSTAPMNGEIMVRPPAADATVRNPAIQTAPAAAPQYMQGFEGAATAPFPPEALKMLGAPVNPWEVEIKPNGIVFLPGVAYRRILTRAFGAGAWALLPRSPARTMGNEVIYHGALVILGRFVSEAVGECASNGGGMSYASALEGARTDCLTRCCKDLGMATELWDATWRTAWQANFCTKEWREGRDGKKGSYVWSKVGNGGGEPTGRNVGGPVANELEKTLKASLDQVKEAKAADAPKDEARAAFTAPGVTNGSTSTDTAASASDTGGAPTDGEVAAVRAAIKALGWAAPKARSWAKNTFGVSGSGEMTKDQCAAALALLMAAQLDDNDTAYAVVYDKLKAEGRVL